jgi:hypothetical protein
MCVDHFETVPVEFLFRPIKDSLAKNKYTEEYDTYGKFFGLMQQLPGPTCTSGRRDEHAMFNCPFYVTLGFYHTGSYSREWR